MHRRSLATRSREIYSCKFLNFQKVQGEKCKILYEIEVITQAGTYVKEFVHGDVGRTSPNLQDKIRKFLGNESLRSDLLALDVMEIDFAWPPKIE